MRFAALIVVSAQHDQGLHSVLLLFFGYSYLFVRLFIFSLPVCLSLQWLCLYVLTYEALENKVSLPHLSLL